VLLDKEEGLILFSYFTFLNGQKVFRHIYYNYLKDEIVSDTGQFQPLKFIWALDRERVLVYDFSQSYPYRKDEGFIDFYIYNRINGEKIRNKFTDTVKSLIPKNDNLKEHGAMSWGRRYLISDVEAKGYDGNLKISWNEDFSKTEVLPVREILRQQLQNQRYYVNSFVLSPTGEWVTTRVGGYNGLYNESLWKRAFYHMDNKYPGSMSMPVLSEEYEGRNESERAFVNHLIGNPRLYANNDLPWELEALKEGDFKEKHKDYKHKNSNIWCDILEEQANNYASGICRISPEEAQEKANLGYVVIAAWKNPEYGETKPPHYATVRPGFQYISTSGPMVANVGEKNNKEISASGGFGELRYKDIKFYYDRNQNFIFNTKNIEKLERGEFL
jgi:hypothetical protein